MAINTLAVLVLAACAATAVGEMEQLPNEYIIVFPESTKITANQQYSEVYREYGRFQCATRTGVFPLWVINGNSAASIKSEPGFENVTYNMYPIPENGTFTLLYVPGFVETNNSVIRCGAIVDSKVVAFSEAVNFTVYCDWNCSVYRDYADYGGTTAAEDYGGTTAAEDYGGTTAAEDYTETTETTETTGVSVVVVIGILMAAVALTLMAAIGIWAKRKRRRQIGQRERTQQNVYWNSSGARNLLEESIASQDMKTAPELPK